MEEFYLLVEAIQLAPRLYPKQPEEVDRQFSHMFIPFRFIVLISCSGPRQKRCDVVKVRGFGWCWVLPLPFSDLLQKSE